MLAEKMRMDEEREFLLLERAELEHQWKEENTLLSHSSLFGVTSNTDFEFEIINTDELQRPWSGITCATTNSPGRLRAHSVSNWETESCCSVLPPIEESKSVDFSTQMSLDSVDTSTEEAAHITQLIEFLIQSNPNSFDSQSFRKGHTVNGLDSLEWVLLSSNQNGGNESEILHDENAWRSTSTAYDQRRASTRSVGVSFRIPTVSDEFWNEGSRPRPSRPGTRKDSSSMSSVVDCIYHRRHSSLSVGAVSVTSDDTLPADILDGVHNDGLFRGIVPSLTETSVFDCSTSAGNIQYQP